MAWRATYRGLHSEAHIERVVDEFYNLERITREVTGPPTRDWGGYLVAKEQGVVVGAIGGGMIGPTTGEVSVLYLEPSRLGRGIDSKLLRALTEQQRGFGASEQWVSAEAHNDKGVLFYLAREFTARETQTRECHNNRKYEVLRLWREL